MTNNAAEVGGFQFLDFIVAGPRQSTRVVTDQKERYLGQQGPGWIYYGDLYAGLRVAMGSVNPRAKLEQVVRHAAAADESRGRAYEEAVAGFFRLLPKASTGIPVKLERWQDDDLTVVMRRMIGIRQAGGKQLFVAPYVKATALDQNGADVLLYLMESVLDQALPGATPVVWDLRQGREFKLRRNTNRTALEQHVRAQAKAYMYVWNTAA
ncbi:hypothetical protein H4696_007456 [Amycolatopsis lexingtonensis]|uniref:Uncharacterized protein n=1 Tax=Amycolatopsis lexingtonensis TaxID=218822 RepID=A0ABR9IB09_9PSEU|nr:hypothetical protein [Amycolatopsis lexingtonensis]MBE1500356.1 hypothetical protein [Amycolatopsis lexingtonensis]